MRAPGPQGVGQHADLDPARAQLAEQRDHLRVGDRMRIPGREVLLQERLGGRHPGPVEHVGQRGAGLGLVGDLPVGPSAARMAAATSSAAAGEVRRAHLAPDRVLVHRVPGRERPAPVEDHRADSHARMLCERPPSVAPITAGRPSARPPQRPSHRPSAGPARWRRFGLRFLFLVPGIRPLSLGSPAGLPGVSPGRAGRGGSMPHSPWPAEAGCARRRRHRMRLVAECASRWPVPRPGSRPAGSR